MISESRETKLRAVIVGAVESTRMAIDAFADALDTWELGLVVTLPLDAMGRHSDFVDLADCAEGAGAVLYRSRQVNDEATLAAIATARPDYIFVIGWSQICGPAFRGLAPERIIGYHPAPIPRLRGRAVIPWTILLQEPISAGTLFWIDEGVDSGPVLTQRFFHVPGHSTATMLYARHMEALAAMMPEALSALAGASPPRIVQDEACATYAARRTPEDGRIDWSRPATEIDRLVRAVTRPYPGAFTSIAGSRLAIWAASLLPEEPPHHAAPGQIVRLAGNTVVIQTGDGVIRLDEWEGEASPRLVVHAKLGDTR